MTICEFRAVRRATALTVLCVLNTGCHQKSVPQYRVLDGRTPLGMVISESELATIVVCHDTLGRPERPLVTFETSRCTPCLPYSMHGSFDRLRAHARTMWMQTARAPYDSSEVGAACVRLAYDEMRTLRPQHDSTLVEVALFQLAATNDSVRRSALHMLDSALLSRAHEGPDERASLLLGQLALGIWDRAQRQLERPREIPVNDAEVRVHSLADAAPSFAVLPRIPRTSDELGESEAEWAARLFEAAASRAPTREARSHWLRLSLAPWVVLNRWKSLDSAAVSLLPRFGNDSALQPARALAAFKRMRKPVLESPAVMTLFDSAVRALPRVDSARYDGFDGVLATADDEWRYGFLPDDRLSLDSRGWAVLDPLWSTPVNEIRLERRARVAEADYRYADVARSGEAGAETRSGLMLLRRGPPDPRWIRWRMAADRRRFFARGWKDMTAVVELADNADQWRVFYGTRFSGSSLYAFPLSPGVRCLDADRESISNAVRLCRSAAGHVGRRSILSPHRLD